MSNQEVIESRLTVSRDDCLLWAGTMHSRGYGVIYSYRNVYHAHRVVYENQVGEIPDGYHLDHLCMVPSCINVDHLEPVTPKENAHRADKVYGIGSAKTHCPQGHEYSEENTYVYYDKKASYTSRKCRTCRRESKFREYYRKKLKKEQTV